MLVTRIRGRELMDLRDTDSRVEVAFCLQRGENYGQITDIEKLIYRI